MGTESKQRLKVGDRVVAIRGGYGTEIDKQYTVSGYAKPTSLGKWVMLEDFHSNACDGSVPEIDLEPAPLFAVGDRVRIKDKSPCYDGALGRIVEIDGDFRPYKVDLEKPIELYGDTFLWRDADEMEHVAASPEAATLKIEAGKYYRTRDGRKVGPMEAWQWGGWSAPRADRPFCGGIWEDDGSPRYKNMEDSPTLVAEWPDAPVASAKACPAAEVDNLRDEYGPFTRGRMIDISSAREVIVDGRVIKSSFAVAATRPAIVARIDNKGKPRPNPQPYVHPDAEAATREAERLARANPGVEFAVYEQVAVRREAKVYDYEWQRLAANGERLAAVKELRRMAGVSLVAAVKAVDYVREAA